MIIRIPLVLRRSPAFSAIAILALASVMALSTTVFGIVDGLLYPRYPVRDQHQLYRLEFYPPSSVVRDAHQLSEARRAAERVVAERSAFFESSTSERYWGFELALEGNGRTTTAFRARLAALNYFEVLGMKPAHGRFFLATETEATERVAVVSYNLWRSLSVEGQEFAPFQLRAEGGRMTPRGASEVTVIGVMPRGAEAVTTDIVIPGDLLPGSRGLVPLLVRAKPGFDRTEIDAELARINASIANAYGTPADSSRFVLRPITRTAAPAQRLYLALTAAAIAILLISGANLANVQLARGMARRGEMAIRMAMGASRADVVRLLTWESGQIALMGAAVGVVLSVWGMQLAVAALPEGIPGIGRISPQLSWRVLVVAGIGAVASVGVMGLLPALRLSSFDLTDAIKWGAGTGTVRARSRRYAALVIAQIAASLALAVGAALVVDAAVALHTLPFGYDIRPIAGVSVRAPGHWRNSSLDQAEALAALRAIPGVESAALWHHFHYDSAAVTVETAYGDMQVFEMPAGSFIGRWTTPDFFRTLGVRPIQGEDFPTDDAVPAVIVDSIAAAQIWKGASPVGRMMRLGAGSATRRPFVRVIGVVPHLRWEVGQYGDAVYDLQIYYIGRTLGAAKPNFFFGRGIVRGQDGSQVATALRHAGRADGRFIAAAAWRSYIGLDRAVASHDILSIVFGIFAVLALGLAATGVYSVVAYSVACRRREMGVRMALGASRERIFVMVLREENLTTLLGLAFGLLAAEWGLKFISETIFWTSPQQQMTVMIAATVGMFVVAMLAAGVPGARAARVSPAEALRAD